MTARSACITCGAELRGRFCHECGEKRREPDDLTLPAFLRYAFEAVTNADAKLYRTLRLLITRPGLLTRDFIAGRRTPYIAPLQLFLLVNVVYFLSLHTLLRTDAFTTDLAFHMTQPIYGSTAQRLLEARIGELPERGPGEPVMNWARRWSREQLAYRASFQAASPRYANSLVIVMVPLLALALRLLRRRTTIVKELIFSLHFMALVLLMLMAVPALGLLLFFLGLPLLRSDALFSVLMTVLLIAWLAPALRRVHDDPVAAAGLRTAAVIVLLFTVVTLYRGLLFFVVHTFI